MSNINRPTVIVEILRQAKEIIDSDRTWEEKYDLIFSADISQKFRKYYPRFEYVDPDTYYEEDVMAWYDAATDFVNSIPIIDPTTLEMREICEREKRAVGENTFVAGWYQAFAWMQSQANN